MIFGEKPRGRESVAWLGAGAWVAFIYLTIPLARSIQEIARARGGPAVFLWVTLLCFAAAAGGLVRAALRKQWSGRPIQILILVAIGGLYSRLAWSLRTNPEEAFHFVQYGVLSLLLFRALGHRLRDPSIYAVAALIGAAFGIFDELIQWVVPRRFFDYRDIGINALAAGLAQVALAAGIRPGFVRRPASPAGIQLACRAAMAILLLLLFCISNTPGALDFYSRHWPGAAALDQATAEYGFRIEDPAIGVFFSRLPAEALKRLDRERGAEAAAILASTRSDSQYARFLAETPAHRDPPAVEARIHVFRRDRHAGEALWRKDPGEAAYYARIARGENRILNAYFSNTLARSGFAWPAERERRIEELSREAPPYRSAVSSQLITRFSRTQGTAVLLLLLLAAGAGERWAARRKHP